LPVFARLELMNIIDGQLYDDATGVPYDVINSYNYNPKFGYLRDATWLQPGMQALK